MYHCNVGGADRVERIAHGVLFILIGLFLVTGVWKIVITAYGVIRLTTGLFAFCPVYLLFKVDTSAGKNKSPAP